MDYEMSDDDFVDVSQRIDNGADGALVDEGDGEEEEDNEDEGDAGWSSEEKRRRHKWQKLQTFPTCYKLTNFANICQKFPKLTNIC